MASVSVVPTTGRFRVRVRRPGAPAQSKTFSKRQNAEAWGRMVESQIERNLWCPSSAAVTTRVVEAIDRYASRLHGNLLLKRKDPTRVLHVPAGSDHVPDAVRKLEGLQVGRVPRGKLLNALAAAPVLGVQMLGNPGEASILRQLQVEPLAKRTLSAITSSDIAALRDRWTAAGLAPASVHRRMHTLGHLFTVAKREWAMPELANPVHGVELPLEDLARDRRVSEAELAAICAAGADTRHLTDFVRLAVETACRREELWGLRWTDINLEARTLRLRKTKNGRPRTVPLTCAAVKILEGVERSGERVFGGWTAPDSVTQAFVRAVARARKAHVEECQAGGIDPGSFLVDIRLHDLRHEGISRLAARNIEMHQLARITGHLTPRMLLRYYNPTDEELVALVD